MNNSVYLQVSAVFFYALLCLVFFLKKRVKNIETQFYSAFIIVNFIGLIIDIGLAVASKYMNYESFLYNLIARSYLVYFVVWISLFNIYIYLVAKNIKSFYSKSKLETGLYFFLLFMLFNIVMVLLCPNYYTKDDYGAHSYGFATYYTYFVAFINILISIFLIVKSDFKKNKIKYIPVLILGVLLTLSMLIQMLNPSLIFMPTVLSITAFAMYFTIENPDAKMLVEVENARDLAEKANRAKSDFLSSMSHEIRTPLNAIVGLSEDIASFEKKVPKQVREDTEDIINASNTLLEIVGNILDISKIESDKLDIVSAPYHFQEEIEKLAKVDATRIGNKPIDFKVHFAHDLPYELIGDKVHVKQIVNNLLTNAIKYTDEGYVKLDVKCINNKDKCLLIVSVEDSGRGIKKESISKLFNKFERLEEQNSTIEGTGLGLAITKKLLDMMGGKINVNSTFGKGSIFVAQIPQKISKMNKPKEESKNTKTKYRDDYKGMKVLVVDDNMLNIKVAERALSLLNFTIESSISGQDCLDKINNGNKYDVILLDIMMPEMSGETTLKELKKIDGFNTPVIALTADAVQGAKEKYLEEGFDGYIAKPFTRDQIKEKLGKIIK